MCKSLNHLNCVSLCTMNALVLTQSPYITQRDRNPYNSPHNRYRSDIFTTQRV